MTTVDTLVPEQLWQAIEPLLPSPSRCRPSTPTAPGWFHADRYRCGLVRRVVAKDRTAADGLRLA